METCNAVQTYASVDESYRVTVQMKSLLQCFRKVRTISFRGDFSSFFSNLATTRSERVKDGAS